MEQPPAVALDDWMRPCSLETHRDFQEFVLVEGSAAAAAVVVEAVEMEEVVEHAE
jgi:hypothetical protein